MNDVRWGIGTVVAMVGFALFAASAAAITTDGTAPLPTKPELRRAAESLVANGRRGVSGRSYAARPTHAGTTARAAATRRAGVALSALESGLLARLNAVRRAHGLRALRISTALSAAADYHSRQMLQHGFFEHESRGGGAFWKRVERFYGSRGYRSWEVGENLAYGSPDLSAPETVRMWMNSPGHRQNLLSRRWREVGLGAVHVASAGGEFRGGPVTVITADFGIRAR